MSRPAVPRRVLLALSVALLVASSSQADFPWFGQAKQVPAAPIKWIEDPAEALAAAAKTGKPIMAYVTSTNCGYCRKMEKETWTEPAVGRLVGQNFIPLKLLADDHPEAVAALKVRAFPTTVLVTPQGRAFAGKPGFMEPLEVAELLRPAMQPREVAARPAAVN